MGKRRTYSTEFKLEAIEMAKQAGVTKAQVCRELGLNPNMIGRWERELADSGSKARCVTLESVAGKNALSEALTDQTEIFE